MKLFIKVCLLLGPIFSPLYSIANENVDELGDEVFIDGVPRFQACILKSKPDAEQKAQALLFGVISDWKKSTIEGSERVTRDDFQVHIVQKSLAVVNLIDLQKRIVISFGVQYLCLHSKK